MLFILLLSLVFAMKANSDVITATSKTFDKIIESKLPVFVKFYAPWFGFNYSVSEFFVFLFSLGVAIVNH